MKYLLSFILLFPLCLMAQKSKVKAYTWERIRVDSTWEIKTDRAQAIVDEYKSRVDSVMAPPLGLSRKFMTAERPQSLLGNWMADMLLECSTATGLPKADMAILNIGGMRSSMPEGVVTVGDIYKISPFENSLVVVELKGNHLIELMENIASVGGEAVSKEVTLKIGEGGKVLEAKINGEAIDKKKTYRIVTIDYLAQGNDRMVALAKASKTHELGIMLRDAAMDFVRKSRTIDSSLDNRITIQK